MKKQGLSLMLAGVMALGIGSTTAFAAPEAVSTQSENLSEGWTPGPVATLYAPDGRTLTIPQSQVGTYLNLGWYSVPVTTVYALDGRTLVVDRTKVADFLQVGWYAVPVTTMYALDGRTMIVDCGQVDDYLKVDWYTAPVTQLYAPYGRTIVVAKTEVDDYIRAGWYGMSVTELYAPDGRTMVVPSTDVEAHMQVGWYLRENYICHVADNRAANYGYSSAVSWLDDALNIENLTDQEWNTLWVKRSFLMSDWMDEIGCPVAIEGYYMTEDRYGRPEVNIMLRNLSLEEMVAFELNFTCLDVFGEPTSDYGSDGTIKGYNYDTSILPGEVSTRTWVLENNQSTRRIRNAYMVRCAFADGSVWYN